MILKNILSMSVANIYKALISFFLNILIAYFVLPAEYGLVTFSLPFITFIAMLTDLGLSSALVRQEKLTSEQAGAAFTLMVVIGIFGALLLCFSGFLMEDASSLPGILGVMVGLSVSVVLSIVAITPRAMLERHLRYQTIALVEALSVTLAGILAISLAMIGWGVWAFVVYYIVIQIVRAGCFVYLSHSKITINFGWKQVIPMLSVGGWVLASNVLNFAARRADIILIGSFIGASAVGLYGFAYQFMTIPLMVLGWPASSVLMATLSRMRDAHAARQGLIIAGMMTITSALTFPAMLYLSFGTDFLVNTLLAKSWKDVIPLITVLAPVGAIQSIAVYNGAVLLANGHARLQFIVGAVNTLLLLATFAATVTQGIQFMVSAYAVVAVPLSAWMVWITCSKGGVSPLRFASSLLPAVLATGAGSAAVYLTTGFSLTSLQLWGTATVIYGFAVLLVYAFMSTRLRASLAMLSNPGDIAPTVAADS